MPDRNPRWQGYLTLENIDEVHERLKDLLSGWFTFVANTSEDGPHYPPRVFTSQRALHVTLHDGSIHVGGGCESFAITTHHRDLKAAQEEKDFKRQVHLVFDPGKVIIRFRGASWWVAAIERHED